MMTDSPKILVVTGGTVSGLGKGTAISSLGVVLKSHGIRVTAMKIDPYLNVDAGTMSPFEHGEVFVLDDGAEADLDLGNYERFLDLTLTGSHSLTTGKIYDQVIKRERAGEYLGKTVQMVPHVTDAIQEWILNVAREPAGRTGEPPELCLVELGGTVGDIESAVYLEALQQLSFKIGPDNFMMVHLGFVPLLGATGEQKTKPTQHSVKLLREAGLKPDLLFCRSEEPLCEDTRHKLSLFCQVQPEHVVSMHNVSNIYRVPLLMAEQNVGQFICTRFKLTAKVNVIQPVLSGVKFRGICDDELEDNGDERLHDWRMMAERVELLSVDVRIVVVGKYTGMQDSYMSVVKALRHASIEAGLHLVLEWIESTDLEPNMRSHDPDAYDVAWRKLKNCQGVLVPGGFGSRGIEGMILAANYCRESNTPYFGICVGLQISVIEAARTLLKLDDANSTEFDEKTKHPVVIFMPEVSTTQMGGTMRLGSRVTIIRDKDSLAYKLYDQQPVVYERHRHRYEVNPQMVRQLESIGLKFVGQDDRGQRMEIMEYTGKEDPPHPFYFAVQFHPELKSRPNRPSPPILGFVLASGGLLDKRLEMDGGSLKVSAGFARKPVVRQAA
eukprot:GEMP01010079.1.p1 GENE.GEMP01010079.1~~GEMP01010079.1.p1  ORF type:complete len:619 (+),score=123.67 GEMP01010079.1:25-1857(+)